MATIYGTAGNDTLMGVESDDVDQLVGLAGNDLLFTTNPRGAGLYGGAGNDTLRAEFSAASTSGSPVNFSSVQGMDGGLGDDELLVTGTVQHTTSGGISFTNSLDAGAGSDLIRVLAQLSVQNGGQAMTAGIWNFRIDGGSGDDRIFLTSHLVTDSVDTSRTPAGRYIESVLGGYGDDLIRSTASITLTNVDAAASAYMEKQIDGGDGDDTIFSSSEIVSHASGSATIVDTITGGDGNDRITVIDTMTLTSKNLSDIALINHNIDGGDGDDTVRIDSHVTLGSFPQPYGSIYSFPLFGGNGNDRFMLEQTVDFTSDAPFALDGGFFVLAGDGDDWIKASVRVNASAEQLKASLDQGGYSLFGVSFEGNDGNDTIQLSHSGLAGVGCGGSGGAGNDRMLISVSNSINSEIYAEGGAGNDRLVTSITNSTNSRNFAYAGDGNDRIIVSGGNGAASGGVPAGNFIYGGAGNDTVTASSGTDNFGFEFGELINGVRERDVITNFSAAEGDAIRLQNGADDVTGWRVAGGNTLLTLFGDGDLVVLRDFVLQDLSDLLFV